MPADTHRVDLDAFPLGAGGGLVGRHTLVALAIGEENDGRGLLREALFCIRLLFHRLESEAETIAYGGSADGLEGPERAERREVVGRERRVEACRVAKRDEPNQSVGWQAFD